MKEVSEITFKIHVTESGNLIAIESEVDVAFKFKRVFWMFDMTPSTIRGKHANKYSTLCLIVVSGSCTVCVDNGFQTEELLLSKPERGIIIPPMVWRTMYNFSPDCVLLALSDKNYDPNEYINNYENFLEVMQANKK